LIFAHLRWPKLEFRCHTYEESNKSYGTHHQNACRVEEEEEEEEEAMSSSNTTKPFFYFGPWMLQTRAENHRCYSGEENSVCSNCSSRQKKQSIGKSYEEEEN
jgi:hypothetical protein